MDKTTVLNPTDAEPTDIKAAVAECIKEIDRVRKRIESDQEEIDSLKSETREILARLKAA
ncbi:MAG TPA: hypothetical protein VJH03_11075 [Blastocatellia bacterium]|nr:hypothetical protein [Blastocatellia bacterium]